MKNRVALLMIASFIILNGCIPSLHGIVSEGDEILNDRIIGTWIVSDEGEDSSSDYRDQMIWNFERASTITFSNKDGSHTSSLPVGAESLRPDMRVIEKKDLPYYLLTHTDISNGDTTTTYLVVKLTVISDLLLMDMIPYPVDEGPLSGRFYANFVYAHTFAKVSFTDSGLSISAFDGDYIESLLRHKSIRLKHETIHNDDIVLTAQPEELRAFITKYADDSQLFDDTEILQRTKDR